jgi:hypothetical protein
MWFIWVLTLIVIIIFYLWVATIFFSLFIEVIVNISLLWITLTRGYVEIRNEKKEKYYLISLLITTLLFLISHTSLTNLSLRIHIWWPVLFIVIMFMLSQIVIYLGKINLLIGNP